MVVSPPDAADREEDENAPPSSSSEELPPTSAFVQEAACAERVIVLKVRVPGKTYLIVVGATRSGVSGAGVISSEARREIWGGRLPPGAARQKAREDALAANTRVLALGMNEAFIDQHGDPRVVRADAGRVVVTDCNSNELVRAGLTPFVSLSAQELADLETRGLALLHAIAADAVDSRRAEIIKVLERATQRIDRRREAIRGDLGKIGQADKLAEQAQWLVAEAARAPRGATKLVVTDWSTGEAVPVVVPLDPSKSAKDQVAAMFKRAKRLRLGARIAEERLLQADNQHRAIEAARVSTSSAASLPDLEEVLRVAKRSAPRDVTLSTTAVGSSASSSSGQRSGEKASKKAGAKQERTPHRVFFARSGRKLLVGKGAADNDTLTLRIARPHDLWLHAKDRTGAHVIVPLDRGQTCISEDLVDAAHLAAHFSEAREEKVVDVQYTDRRYIRKPKGSAPGAVVVDREKVLVLRVEADLLRGLLEREDV